MGTKLIEWSNPITWITLSKSNLPIKTEMEMSALQKVNDLTTINGLTQSNPPQNAFKTA